MCLWRDIYVFVFLSMMPVNGIFSLLTAQNPYLFFKTWLKCHCFSETRLNWPHLSGMFSQYTVSLQQVITLSGGYFLCFFSFFFKNRI